MTGHDFALLGAVCFWLALWLLALGLLWPPAAVSGALALLAALLSGAVAALEMPDEEERS